MAEHSMLDSLESKEIYENIIRSMNSDGGSLPNSLDKH